MDSKAERGLKPVKHLRCTRCGRVINPKVFRYLWVGWGERGASRFGKQGNSVFGRVREQAEAVLCGPCGDEWRVNMKTFLLGANNFVSLDSFERGVVRD